MSTTKTRPDLTLTAAAKALGVTREHLSRVLHGHRESRSLLRRYAAMTHAPHPTLRRKAS
jgi:transcriptional regulator with XRE-family HTH domain